MKVVIIGAGPAGVTVAETLRQSASNIDITMISKEPFPPYSPPAMLEYFLEGREVHFWKGKDFPQKLNINYQSGVAVNKIVPDKNEIQLSNNSSLSYDYLVIASGSRLYAPLEGVDKKGIHNFKSLSAAEEMLQQIKSNKANNAVIVGAGFIGVEIALLLKKMGLTVTLLEKDRVMGAILDPETSDLVCQILKERGIQIKMGAEGEALAFLGDSRAESVKLKSGQELQAEILIAATGLKPNIEFLEGSNIKMNWGISVDDTMRSNINNIFAAGDVAETKDRITNQTYVNAIFPNAVKQGRIVAQNILGRNKVYEGSERMNSLKHLDLPIMAVGLQEGEVLCQRNQDGIRKIFLQNNCIVGFRFAGDISSAGVLQSLIYKKTDIKSIKHRLLDPNFGMGMIFDSVQFPEMNLV